MLSPELKKLKDQLQGKILEIDRDKLLNELQKLDGINQESSQGINKRSLSITSGVCKSCGRPLNKR